MGRAKDRLQQVARAKHDETGTQSATQETSDRSGATSSCADTGCTKISAPAAAITSITSSLEPAVPVQAEKSPMIRKVSSLMRMNAFSDRAGEVSTQPCQAPAIRMLPRRVHRAVTAPAGSQLVPHEVD